MVKENIIEHLKCGMYNNLDLIDYSNQLKQNKNNFPALFRYSPADYNNIRNLETQTIYLSNVGSMNDIFEGLSSTLDAESNKLIECAGNLAYFKSFSECENDLKMWGQYADSYAGMCIEYDIRTIDDNLIYHLFPVTYTNTRINNDKLKFALKHFKKRHDETFDKFFLQDITSLFLFKPECWKNEKEWRVIFSWLHLNFEADEILYCDKKEEVLFAYKEQTIDFPYAKAVYMGPKMPNHIKDHISEIADKINIEAYEMILDEHEYILKPKKYFRKNY